MSTRTRRAADDALTPRSAHSIPLNPFVIKGIPAAGIGGTFDTLTVRSEDEPSSEYGLVAEKIELGTR